MGTAIQSKPKLPGFINLLLAIALGISLAKLMWLVLTPAPTVSAYSAAKTSSSIKPKTRINYGKLIADQHIFGEKKVKQVAVVKKEPEAPKKEAVTLTKLNLKLHGIVAYKSKEGFALISVSNGPQKVFGKGEPIQEGATINDILPDKVIINNRGTTEELLLPINEIAAKDAKSRMSSGGNSHLPGNNEKQKKKNRSPISNQLNLSQLRGEFMANPAKLMDVVNPSPAVVDGKFIGFRIRPGRKRKLFRQLNFRTNDIITEVNGIILDDQSKGTMVLTELSQASTISLKIKRGNQELVIDHSF